MNRSRLLIVLAATVALANPLAAGVVFTDITSTLHVTQRGIGTVDFAGGPGVASIAGEREGDGLALSWRTGTQAKSSDGIVQVDVDDGTFLSFAHDRLLDNFNADAFLSSNIRAGTRFSPFAAWRTFSGIFSYTGEVAPGDYLRVNIQGGWDPDPGAAGPYRAVSILSDEFRNETNEVLRVEGSIPGITFGAGVAGPFGGGQLIGMTVELLIIKNSGSPFHQASGTTWVSVDPGVGTNDPTAQPPPATVPEPASFAIFSIGALGVIAIGRRRKGRADEAV